MTPPALTATPRPRRWALLSDVKAANRRGGQHGAPGAATWPAWHLHQPTVTWPHWAGGPCPLPHLQGNARGAWGDAGLGGAGRRGTWGDAGRCGGLTGREGMDVEGHVLLLTVHHVQQVGTDGPLGRVRTEVQDHHPQHREDDANGLPVGDIAKGQAWGSTWGRETSAPTRSRSRPHWMAVPSAQDARPGAAASPHHTSCS